MEVAGGFEDKAAAQKTPETSARRWILELQMAKKREKDWRRAGSDVYDRYRGKKTRKNSFNILWANTEVLRPALCNSPPKPDVRRRFRSNDALGKAVSEVLERGIAFSVDAYDLFEVVKDDVLDMLLPGRGISRVRYIPSIRAVGAAEGASTEQPEEELEYEQVCCEHVDWEDFLHGPGKTWSEVQWEAFRHRFTKDDATTKFGAEVAGKLKYDEVKDDTLEKDGNKDLQQVFKTAEMWEVWDKEGKKVFFIQEAYKESPIYPKDQKQEGAPPLKFKNFFPTAKPLMAVEDSSSLIPIPLFEQYKEQAEELDRVSTRINKLVNQMKVRGIYDSVLTELADLMKSDDGDLTPAENTAKLYALNGDLSKAVWMLPVDMLARVLSELYKARVEAKAAIYEITGIADIVRGNTNASETLGAQELKANFANLRLSRLQKEVQRYVRDIIRLMAEVIGEQFDVTTLAQMTGLQFPTAEQKVMAKQVLQQMQAQQQMQQPGQPPMAPQMPHAMDPETAKAMAGLPSWEEIKKVLMSDFAREYRVDVETDSTVADTLNNDMAGLREVLTGLVQFWQGAGPAVMSGALPIEAVKSISLSICRRAKLGLEVEDAIEQMKQPTPPQQPEAPADHSLEVKQIEVQSAGQLEAQRQQAEGQREQLRVQAENQREQFRVQHEQMMEAARHEHEKALKQMELASSEAFERWKVDVEARTKIQVAEIAANVTIQTAQASAAQEAAKGEQVKAERQAKEKEKASEKAQEKEKPKLPDIHVHLPSGKKTITTPKGDKYTSEDA